METCEILSLSSKGIQRISGGPSLPKLDVKDLSRDQAYLYKIIKATQSGVMMHPNGRPIRYRTVHCITSII